MSELGDTFKAIHEERRDQRARSHEAALEQLDEARRAAVAVGLDLVASNDGHHWLFYLGAELVLNFWPASAKGMLRSGKRFRVRGALHAVELAAKLREDRQ